MKPRPGRRFATAHLANARRIIAALSKAEPGRESNHGQASKDYLRLPGLKSFQRHLYVRFTDVITKPSFNYISKTADTWLIVGDRRREIAGDILLIIERHGLGIGMLVLYAQQILSGHILTRVQSNNGFLNLVTPTEHLTGARGEQVLSIPIRQFRANFDRLAALNIAKPQTLWKRERIVTHESDLFPCFYCSCPEINPVEVVVDLEGSRHGLSRDYSLGFTFAPFGNPLSVVHFLAWDRAHKPLNMTRVPMTVSDLVKLTREINLSIRAFFADTGVVDYPVLDGLSNGWAGNTVFHQHFQFFQPELPSAILGARAANRPALIHHDDMTVQRLAWPSPVYRVSALEALNAGLVGNDLSGIWRLLGGARRVPYKSFRDGYTPADGELIPAHTQNLYIPGRDSGRTAFLVLRDRERVNYQPASEDFVNRETRQRPQAKDNIGVLEATGTMIVEDRASFIAMKKWTAADLSRQMNLLLEAMAPDQGKVAEFESTVRDLFPR